MAIITKMIFVIFHQFLGIFGTFLDFLKIIFWIKSLQKSKKIQLNLEKIVKTAMIKNWKFSRLLVIFWNFLGILVFRVNWIVTRNFPDVSSARVCDHQNKLGVPKWTVVELTSWFQECWMKGNKPWGPTSRLLLLCSSPGTFLFGGPKRNGSVPAKVSRGTLLLGGGGGGGGLKVKSVSVGVRPGTKLCSMAGSHRVGFWNIFGSLTFASSQNSLWPGTLCVVENERKGGAASS